jgi:hypothetical protein
VSTPRKKLTAKRVLKHVAVVVLGAYALYLLAIHILIATPLLRKITNQNSEKLFIAYGSAWSVWPGRLHIKALRIRWKDSYVESYVTFDKVVGTFDLVSLMKQQLRVRDVDATGVTVRVRPRLAPEEATPDALEGVAEIPGFTGPPLKKTEPRKVMTDENYKFFDIDLEDARIESLRELWIGPYRFAGDARATGGFYVRPNRKFMLRPSHMTVKSGNLTLAKRFFGQDVRGTIDMKIAMHDPRAVDGIEFFRHVDTHLKLESGVEDIGFLQRWFGPKAGVRVSGGKGTAKSDVWIEAGVLQNGSVLDLRANRALIHVPNRGSAWTDAVAHLKIENNEWRSTMTMTDVRIERRWAEPYPLRADRIDWLATTRSLDLANKPADDVLASVDVPHAKLTDVRALQGLFGKQGIVEKGVASLKFHADFSVRERLLKAELSIESPRFAMQYEEMHVEARVATGLRLSRLDIDVMNGTVSHGYIEVRDALVRAPNAGRPPPPWWGRLDVKDLAIDRDRKPIAAGSFAFAARDARPALHVVDAKKQTVPEWAKGPLAMDPLSLVGRLELGPGVALEKVRGEGGNIDIGGRVRKEGKRTDGEINLALGPLSLEINLGPGGGMRPGIGGGPKDTP